MGLHEFSPVGPRATGGRDGRRFERFAEGVRIFRIGSGSVMNAMRQMSPPHLGHSSGNSSPTRTMSLAQAIREVSCDRSLSR
jgi:hypothetical protein